MLAQDDWTDGREPKLNEMLKDPIVLALMRRDAVAPRDIKSVLSSGLARRAGEASRKGRSTAA